MSEAHNPGFKYTSREAAEKMMSQVELDPGAWADGVERTGVDVMAEAASEQAEANFKAAMLVVLNDKLRQAGLKEVSTAEWKRICGEKTGNWSSGMSAKRDAILAAVASAIDVTYDVADEVRKLPKGLPGSAQNKARMTGYFDKRVAAKKTRGT